LPEDVSEALQDWRDQVSERLTLAGWRPVPVCMIAVRKKH